MDRWLIVFVTLILSAFFSGMEIAFVSSNKLKVEVDKNKGLFSGKILSGFINIPSKFIGALLLGNNIALVIYGIAMTKILDPAIRKNLYANIESEYLILIITTIISTLLILLVAEFIPKALFRINPNGILKVFAFPVAVFYYVFYPIIYIFIGFAEWILKRLFRIKFSHEKYTFSAIDLDEYVKEFKPGQESTKETNSEFEIFQNAMEFKNIKLRECMIPRTEIVAMDENEPIDALRQKFIETGHSKILVYKESIDNIIGYTHSFDMFKQPQAINAVLKNIIIVPETQLASEVLKMMIQQHKSVAVVVDEFGGTSGMVTLEDIIEEIFGEIEDEYDMEEFVEKKINDKEFLFSARLEIDDLNKKYGFDFPESEDYETLAGFIINHFEDIPEANEEILIDKYIFTITKATDNRIEQIHLRVIED